MSLKRCGVVRFDTADPHQGGWISVDGEVARRITGVSALDNETLWWTNLGFPSLYETNLHRTSYIKRTTYLTSWNTAGEYVGQNEICLAWGLLSRQFTEQQVTEALSQIFSRVMEFCRLNYQIDIGEAVPQYIDLADEIRARLLPVDSHITPEVDAALVAAHQSYAYCWTPRHNEDDTVSVQFVAPPVEYARQILDSDIPCEQFEFLSTAQLPPPSQRLRWVLAQQRPVLASVRVSNVHPDYASVIAFGNGAKGGSNRRWATHPELLLLSQHAQVDVESVFLFGGYERLPKRLLVPHFTSLQAMTPTAEIVASNHWIGLCRENPYQLEKIREATKRALSPRAVWLNAFDRFLMFTYAKQLYRAGISVRRYGAGRVNVLVPKYNYREAYEIATSVGLLAPPTVSTDVLIQEEMQLYA
ncbi:hypothetical protein [Stenotrophomonas maltophilia]|uniref:hypothetical protein n=1 Tax=Stenotrophomonas maltophilia TaxID=40324 RepID=UPI0025569037|nr:hypothetical protein [Stenotrophomonas maltophilia]